MRETLAEVAREVQRVYEEAIDPLAEKYFFERRPTSGEIKGPPMVLFLGNHSSGKSTFINHLLGLELQRTGVAPTDDTFTIITYGDKETERDGAAMATNPELGFETMSGFGPMFLSHLRMKTRPIALLRDVTLIDTPGMIDAAKEGLGRGYDFTGVVRWFAQRADVVLIFFDPEKPGTTGETLQVFTQALQGIEHKLLIVMNKVDQFMSLRDFARAYGALCWNLSKVIPRKDLPMIFTTFVPVDASQPRMPMEDFEKARHELIAEVKRAPERRMDNMLTQLYAHARRLKMHARICSEAAREVRSFRTEMALLISLLFVFGIAAGILAYTAGKEFWIPASIFGGALLAAWGGYHVARLALRRQERHTIGGLEAIFERIYARELLVRDHAEDILAFWRGVQPRTTDILQKLGPLNFKPLQRKEEERINRAIYDEVPALRAKLHRGEPLSPVETAQPG
jgi:GTPase SAR1 family protein